MNDIHYLWSLVNQIGKKHILFYLSIIRKYKKVTASWNRTRDIKQKKDPYEEKYYYDHGYVRPFYGDRLYGEE